MNAWRGLVAVVVLGLPCLGRAAPPGTRDPDWPCQQIKVPALSVASMWAGPDLPDHADWRADPEVSVLVRRLSERRVPIAEAEAKVAGFATRAGPQKQARLLVLFLGLFEVMDAERDSVLAGLDRFGRRQRELAAGLRADLAQLNAARAAATPDEAQVNRLTDQVGWENRVFQERRQVLGTVCDVPGQIEQRLFALARAIQREVE